MPVKITSTKDYSANGVKIMVHGAAGIGKTVLSATASNSIIISAEAGLLSLSDIDVPVIEVTSKDEVDEAYDFLTKSEESKNFTTISLDSITEIAETLLTEYKRKEADPRNAYGRLNDDIAELVRKFRDIRGKNVYFSAKQFRLSDDDTNINTYVPSMPGKTLLNGIEYFFDELFAYRKGQLEDGTLYRYLQTFQDLSYKAKDRSGKLSPQEEPNLDKIFNKIAGKVQ